MKNPKRDLLLHLYGEPESESDLRSLLQDEELKSEYTALSEAKFKLDLRKPERPDRHIVDAIMAAAKTNGSSTRPSARTDRGPLARHSRLKRILIPALSIAAAVVFSVGVYWNATNTNVSSEQVASSFADDTIVPPESLYRFVPSRQGGVSPAGSQQATLQWDDGNTLQNLNERIKSLKPADRLEWGEAAMPLEMLPNSNRSGFKTAGSNR